MANTAKSSTSTPGKQPNSPMPRKKTDWLDFVNDCARLAVPVGPGFQAEVSAWTGPSNHHKAGSKPNVSKWLGTKIWPAKAESTDSTKVVDEIGKGRPDFCGCVSPGSSECIKRHITDKSRELQCELGPAFWSWKFDDMGEQVSKLWTLQEESSFATLVKSKPSSPDKTFLKLAVERLPLKSRESIVRYYFNVFVPRRISRRTMSGRKVDDSDEDDDIKEAEPPRRKDSQTTDQVSLRCSKRAKYMYWKRR